MLGKPLYRAAKKTMRRMFWSNGKRKLMTMSVAAAALLSADNYYGSRLLEKHGLVREDLSDYEKEEPCVTADCKTAEKDIAEGVDIWRGLRVDRKHVARFWGIPSYLNTRYALRAAGTESDLGRLSRKKSQFDGTYQFSCVNEDLLLFHRRDVVEPMLNAARDSDKVPALRNLPSGPITLEKLCDRKNRAVFRDTKVQALIKMETALAAAMEIEKKYGRLFTALNEREKHSVLYLSHNLPVMVSVVMKYGACDKPVVNIIPSQRSNFIANKGVYASGQATPADLLARLANYTEPYTVNYQSIWPWERGQTSVSHWGKYGAAHRAVGVLSDVATCPWHWIKAFKLSAKNAGANLG
jgi:hypothetical protein